jgi:hypothetical protein
MAVENRLNLAAGCGAQRISRRCRDARPLGLAATRRAQVIATPSERRLRQGREAPERTLDGGEHRGDLRRWARPILRQIYALFDRRQHRERLKTVTHAKGFEVGPVVSVGPRGTLKTFSQKGFLEQIYGLDDNNTRDIISDAINKDALHLVLAGDSGYKYDIDVPFDAPCKQILADEWNAVLAHHRRIPRPDFQAAGRRLYELIPENSDPVYPRNAP